MAVNASCFFSLNYDTTLFIFSKIESISELCQLGQVCKAWYEIHGKNYLWIPFLKDLSLHSYQDWQEDSKEPEALSTQQSVKKFISKSKVDSLINLMAEDFPLNCVIKDVSLTLETLKQKTLVERSLIVCRALKNDATPFYKYIAEKGFREFLNYKRERHVITNDSLSQFFEEKKCLPILSDLIEEEAGSFKGEEVLHFLFSILDAKPFVLKIVAKIIKSHQPLSNLFSKPVAIYKGTAIVLIQASFILKKLIPVLSEQYGVTLEDWIKCGYTGSVSIP